MQLVTDIDYYDILGLPRWASLEQIKAAYRRRALRHHPDRNPESASAEDLFKRCGEAFSTLADARRRAEYDAKRWASYSPGQLFGELVDEWTGGRLGRKHDGRDLEQTLSLTLEQAASGVRRKITFPVEPTCEDCQGSGAGKGGSRVCGECQGKGILLGGGLLRLPRTCPGCGGQGRRIEQACRRCDGVGTVQSERSVLVTVPGGSDDGERLAYPGQGEPGRFGGRPGNLFVVLVVEPHALFERRGANLWLELPIGFAQAAGGGTADVPTLDGEVLLTIPRGTQSGAVLRLAGKGLPRRQEHGRGDILVRVIVETPIGLSDERVAELRELQRQLPSSTHPQQQLYVQRLEATRAARGFRGGGSDG